jgi:hypothetical protein
LVALLDWGRLKLNHRSETKVPPWNLAAGAKRRFILHGEKRCGKFNMDWQVSHGEG